MSFHPMGRTLEAGKVPRDHRWAQGLSGGNVESNVKPVMRN